MTIVAYDAKLPRRPFLIALAATLFVAAVMVVEPLEPAAPPELPVVGPRAVARAGVAGRAEAVLSPVSTPVDSAELERAVIARFAHVPLAQVFRRKHREPEVVNRIARAIVKEARRLRLEPSLLAGVLLTENARLEPETVSSQGAIGLMQVMHFHAGTFDCASDDLMQIESNICHGAQVFHSYLKRTGNVRTALLRYNGCVTGKHTPNCRRYPTKVLRQANRIRRQLLLASRDHVITQARTSPN